MMTSFKKSVHLRDKKSDKILRGEKDKKKMKKPEHIRKKKLKQGLKA